MFILNNMIITTKINQKYALPNLNHLKLLNEGKSVACINPFTAMMSLEKRPNNMRWHVKGFSSKCKELKVDVGR